MSAPIPTPVPLFASPLAVSTSGGKSVPASVPASVPLEQHIESLRHHQDDGRRAEQQHQLLDIDPDLAARWAGTVIQVGRAA